MTGLLVSVRSAAEACVALAAGVDVIDVKEPLLGSLGAASAAVVRGVVDVVAGRRIVSAACGELLGERTARNGERGTVNADRGAIEQRRLSGVERSAFRVPRSVDLAKIGLSGCNEALDWRQRWRAWAAALTPSVRPVAVVYADCQIARSPYWEDVLAVAAEAKAAYFLVDTFDKSAGTLFDHWSAATLRQCACQVRAAGLGLVLAGSLSGDAVLRAREFSPDFIAVRGAACRGGRGGVVDAAAITALRALVGRSQGVSLPLRAN